MEWVSALPQEKTILCSTSQGGDPGPNYISPGQVAFGATVVLVNALVSVWLKLDMHWQLAVGVIRCVVQLTVLGYILVPIFTYNLWWLVLLYAFFMLLVGCLEAVQRPAYTYKGMLLNAVTCVGSSAGVFLCYTLLFVVRTQPWWAPQYFIPILGMMLGNSISGVSVGLSALLEDFSVGKDRIEQLLALGATRWEATQASIQRCVRVALTPILNQMNVVGIVSIPGMMTGQILSGSDPSQAARYQMIVMFIISASTGVGAVGCLMLTSFYLVDMSNRLRLDRLQKRDKKNNWSRRLARKIATVFAPVTAGVQEFGRCLQNTFCSCCRGKRTTQKEVETEPLLG